MKEKTDLFCVAGEVSPEIIIIIICPKILNIRRLPTIQTSKPPASVIFFGETVAQVIPLARDPTKIRRKPPLLVLSLSQRQIWSEPTSPIDCVSIFPFFCRHQPQTAGFSCRNPPTSPKPLPKRGRTLFYYFLGKNYWKIGQISPVKPFNQRSLTGAAFFLKSVKISRR